MAKRKKRKVVQVLSPENYIKQKARALPIHECWINKGWDEDGLASITISRKHTNGNFTIGLFLIDLKCLGVKDAQYLFNNSPAEYREILERQNLSMELEAVKYVLAHNIILAGIEYAEDYGFSPHKDFAVTQYILEEDTDDIELMEIDCGGEDGQPLYVSGPLDSDVRAAQIISQLEKTTGFGNFDFVDGRLDTEWENKHFDNEYNLVSDDNLFDESQQFIKNGAFDVDDTDIKNSQTFQFKIQIQNISKPPVWRRITVPSYFKFLHLHYVIQAAFGWFDQHLYSFSPGGYSTWPVIKEIDIDSELFELDPGRNLEPSEVKLSEIFSKEGQKFTYIYDFGDDWHHTIILEKIISEISKTPDCIDGKGQCPPEDCGGAWGYENLKEILRDKTHDEYEEYTEWLGLDADETWNPKEFNLQETHKIITELFSTK